MDKEISLKDTVSELEKVTDELTKISNQATGPEKEMLDLKIDLLKNIKDELTVICHHAFPLYVPPKRGPKR